MTKGTTVHRSPARREDRWATRSTLALRYMGAKKRAFISVGTAFAMLGVMLGVAALSIVISVTGGFKDQFREKVLGVNAHVLVLKYSIDFREYREVMNKVRGITGVIGVAPFIINPMMVTHGDHTATGVLLKGVDPVLLPKVLDLPKHITDGSLEGMRRPGAAPQNGARIRSFAIPPLLQREPARAGRRQAEAIPGYPQRHRRQRIPDAGGVPRKGPSVVNPTSEGASSGSPLPDGDVTPPGGFKSQLPESDVLPEEFDPDPCRSAEQIAKLPGAVIGKTLAKRLGVGFGDCLQITSPTIGMSFGAAGARPPVAKQFRVISRIRSGIRPI